MKKSRNFGSIAAAIFLCALALVFMRESLRDIALDYRYSNLVYVSRDLQFKGVKAAQKLPEYVEQTRDIVDQNVCRSDILKSGLTVLLTQLDRQDANKDYDNWVKTVEQTEAYLKHAIACLPTDGNLWLRYAMINQAIAEQPDALAQILAVSQSLAPAEEKIVAGRLRLYNRISSQTLEKARPTVLADVRAAQQFKPDMIASIVPKPSPAFESFLINDAGIAIPKPRS